MATQQELEDVLGEMYDYMGLKYTDFEDLEDDLVARILSASLDTDVETEASSLVNAIEPLLALFGPNEATAVQQTIADMTFSGSAAYLNKMSQYYSAVGQEITANALPSKTIGEAIETTIEELAQPANQNFPKLGQYAKAFGVAGIVLSLGFAGAQVYNAADPEAETVKQATLLGVGTASTALATLVLAPALGAVAAGVIGTAIGGALVYATTENWDDIVDDVVAAKNAATSLADTIEDIVDDYTPIIEAVFDETGSAIGDMIDAGAGLLDDLADAIPPVSIDLPDWIDGPLSDFGGAKDLNSPLVVDLDGDGIKDFFDDCPNTPTGSSVDNNGCAASQIDSDQDGVTDDIDNCPGTPETSVVNSEGCADTDLDLVTDNIDLCPNTILGNDVDEFGCSLDQKDTDNDGVTDDFDQCNETPEGSFVDAYGCTVFSLPRDNYQVVVQSNSCVNSNDGLIYISAKHQDYDYTIAVNDSSYDLNQTTGFELSIDNLSVGTYEICISVVGESDYQQCYSVLVSSPEPLEVFAAQTLSGERVDFQVQGSERYFVNLNDKVKIAHSNATHVLLEKGLNHVRIYTDYDCQGIYEDYFFNSHEVILFPSKTKDNLTLIVGGQDRKMDVYVYNLKGELVFHKYLELGESRRSTLNVSQLSVGIYFLETKGNTVHKTLKFIKDE